MPLRRHLPCLKKMLSLAAPAKLNLFLHIADKRADGYHLLESLSVFVDVCDRLEAEPADDLHLALDGAMAANIGIEDNLVLRAARLLQHHTGTNKGASLRLKKNLPAGAGLGGGSSDAAAALKLLNALWRLELPEATLLHLASRLGSDVPACLSASPVMMRGVGDILSPVAIDAALHAVLAYPNAPLMTKDVYRRYNSAFSAPMTIPDSLNRESLKALLLAARNDLNAAAVQLMPEVEEALQALSIQRGCWLARMSGSGSACFGLFEDQAQAEAAAALLQQAYPSWWVRSAQTFIPALGRIQGIRTDGDYRSGSPHPRG